MFDDTADTKIVIENADVVANLLARGGVVVEDGVVRSLERGAGEKGKGQQVVEALVIDPVDGVEGTVDLHVDRSRDHNVGNLCEDVGDLDGGAGGAHADEIAGGVGTHEHVHADPVLTGLEAVELAHQDRRDGEDHDDFDGDGEAADEGTQGTMDKIADN